MSKAFNQEKKYYSITEVAKMFNSKIKFLPKNTYVNFFGNLI